MSKTPIVGWLLAGLLVACGASGSCGVIAKPHDSKPTSSAGFGDSFVAGPHGLAGDGATPPLWENTTPGTLGGDHDPGNALNRSDLDLNGPNGLGAPQVDALPLSQFAGGGGVAHARPGIWDFLTKVRYGGLPEPASWALILIGFGMIGGAVRGFVVANRRLSRLQPEEPEQQE